jgi:hypothetical protein
MMEWNDSEKFKYMRSVMMTKQKMRYEEKLVMAEMRIREFIAWADDKGKGTHISVGGLDSITLLVFMRNLACDTDAAVPGLERAAESLTKAGFTREHIRCYVLIGDDMEANERRLQAVYAAGAMPFAQLYQPVDTEEKKQYDLAWRKFHRMWSRPEAIVSHVERGTSMWDYST